MKEVTKESVRKLLEAADKDGDGKISLDDLLSFIEKHEVRSITTSIAKAMYNEVTSRRVVTQKHLKDKPITFDELIFCCTSAETA